MDKMIQTEDGEVIITNDGATIMSHLQVLQRNVWNLFSCWVCLVDRSRKCMFLRIFTHDAVTYFESLVSH